MAAGSGGFTACGKNKNRAARAAAHAARAEDHVGVAHGLVDLRANLVGGRPARGAVAAGPAAGVSGCGPGAGARF